MITGTTDLGKGRAAHTVDHDPTSVATDAPKGSLIIEESTGFLYRKTDNGLSTNVTKLESSVEVTGQFSDSGDQLPGVVTPVVITFDTNDITPVGISHSTSVATEEFTADVSKAIAFLMAPQWSLGSNAGMIDFFVQLDTGSGFVNVANSNVKVDSLGNTSGVMPLMLTLNLVTGDKFRFMQKISATGNSEGIKATAAAGGVPARIR